MAHDVEDAKRRDFGSRTDDSSDAYYCVCPRETYISSTTGSCMSEQELCEQSNSEWYEWGGCACGPAGLPGTFLPGLGGCVDDALGSIQCTGSGALWTDDSSDAYYCVCPRGTYISAATGECLDEATLCEQSGGELSEWGGCACGPAGFPGTFLPGLGGCVDDSVGGTQCTSSGGTWTDDSSDAYYCVCPANTYASPSTDECLGEADLCEQSGGQLSEWGGCAFGPAGLPGTFLAGLGGCVDDSVGESQCTSSGGIWTDDSPDAYYCVCPDGSEYYSVYGSCE